VKGVVEGEVLALQGRVFNRKELGRSSFDVNCPGRNLISPVGGWGKRKASANVSDNRTEHSMIAIDININVHCPARFLYVRKSAERAISLGKRWRMPSPSE
jgi:hypothetical protein